MRRKTHEAFIAEMKEKHPHLEVIGHYVNIRTKIEVKCLVCGYVFSPQAGSLYMGHGCPSCAGLITKTNEQFIKEMNDTRPNITPLEPYKNSSTKIKFKCNKCGYIWEALPRTVLLNGRGCINCAGLKKKTNEEFLEEMKTKQPHLTVLEPYKNNHTPIKCHCSICGNDFSMIPHSLLSSDFSCTYCTSSRGERAIMFWLNNNNFNYITEYKFQDCKDKNALPFDFYLPDCNTVIEFDGAQHFVPSDYFGVDAFNKTVEHDNIKNNYCSDNEIRLIRIPYWEINNINNILDKELAS